MGKIGYSDWNNFDKKQDSDKISFFSVKENGEATVRFVYDSVDDIEITSAHLIKTPSLKYGRYVECFRQDAKAPIDDCPLCKAGYEVANRFYVKLIQYVVDDNGRVTLQPKVWDRAAGYAKTIANLIREYGSLKDCIFKIKRTGTGLATEYNILLGAPNVYKDENYPKNFKAFENFDASKFIHRSKEDIEEFLGTGELPAYKKSEDKKENSYKESKASEYVSPIPTPTPAPQEKKVEEEIKPRTWGETSRRSWETPSESKEGNGFRPNRYY